MKIRSITFFYEPKLPVEGKQLDEAGRFISAARPAFEKLGYEVQTARLALSPFSRSLPATGRDGLIELAQDLEGWAEARGFSYLSMGPALPEFPESYEVIPEALGATQNVFFSGVLARTPGGVSLPAVRACAKVIQSASGLTPDGFANLRFAALANVPPGSPFFPAAYHSGGPAAFALALESADLVVDAFRNASTLEAARAAMVDRLEQEGSRLAAAAADLSQQFATRFGGIDFSLAPFPDPSLSLGTAIESLGAPAVGLNGSLAAAAIIADTLDQARFARTGFSGLMLPVLEDSVLAARAADGSLTVNDLLMYSAVCGTGLDTVPLPGDTSQEALAALLLDMAALAQRLDKPLTARLMPIPGKAAGDPTGFDFAFFANSRVMALKASPLKSFFAGDESFSLARRQW